MNRMLTSSRLLPATILAIVAVLGTRTVFLIGSGPDSGSATRGAGLGFGIVGQAHAAAEPTPTRTAAVPQAPAPSTKPPVVSPPVVAPAAIPAAAAPVVLPVAPPPAPPVAAAVEAPPAVSAPVDAPVAAPITAPMLAITPAPVPAASLKEGTVRLHTSLSDQRERQLAEREAVLSAANKRLGERVEELVGLQTRLQALQNGLKEREEANWGGLVKLYEGMRPRDAAVIFNALDKPVLLDLLDRMKPAKAGPVIAAMEPEKARQVTAELAAKRTRSTNILN